MEGPSVIDLKAGGYQDIVEYRPFFTNTDVLFKSDNFWGEGGGGFLKQSTGIFSKDSGNTMKVNIGNF